MSSSLDSGELEPYNTSLLTFSIRSLASVSSDRILEYLLVSGKGASSMNFCDAPPATYSLELLALF